MYDNDDLLRTNRSAKRMVEFAATTRLQQTCYTAQSRIHINSSKKNDRQIRGDNQIATNVLYSTALYKKKSNNSTEAQSISTTDGRIRGENQITTNVLHNTGLYSKKKGSKV